MKNIFMRFYILLFFLIYTFRLSAQLNDLKFEHLDVHSGLSNSQIKCVLQDRYGFLWVGTRDGLNKYDGYGFTSYRPQANNAKSLLANEILSIYEDDKNNLWVGTLTGGLSLYDRENDNFINFVPDKNNPNSILSQNVYAILEDILGFLWIGTDAGLSCLSPDRKTFRHFLTQSTQKYAISHDFITALYEDSNKNLWIGTKEGGLNLYQREKENFISYQVKDNQGLCGNYISSITEDKKGNLILGTYSGVSIALKKGKQLTDFYCFTKEEKNPNSLSNTQNGFVLLDENNRWWIVDNNSSGLNIVDYQYDIDGKPKIDFIKKYTNLPLNPQSLASNRIRCVYKDRTGIYWLGTELGLDKYVPFKQKFQHVHNYLMSDTNGLNNNEVRAFVEDENNTVWLATYGGGLSSFSPKTGQIKAYPHNFKNKDALKSRQILLGADGLIWVTASGGGLYAFDLQTEKYKYIFENDNNNPNSLIDNSVGAIYEDQDKILWIGTEAGLCKLTYENRAKGKFDDLRQLADDKLNTILEDREGFLWIATETNGIIRMKKDGSEKTVFRHNPANPLSLPQDNVRLIYKDETDKIWVGTGAGLCLYIPENKGFKIYNEKNGFPNSVINGVLQHKRDYWIATNDGLLQFNPETNQLHIFKEEDGLQSNEFRKRSFYKGKSGKLFFGGLNGFNYFYPSQIKSDTSKAEVVLTDLKIFNKSVIIGKDSPLKKHITLIEAITLHSDRDYVFSIDFAALHFHTPSRNQYAYKLENFENEWNFVDAKKRFATYTNLDAGTYYFKVKATNADGIWNEKEKILKINILPPFWKTDWFIGLMITMIVIGAVAFYRFRIRQIRLQNEKLENLVNQRTLELDAEKKLVEARNMLLEEQREEILSKNIELEQSQDEILAQRDFIEKKNEELIETLRLLNIQNEKITSSIRYAQTIQHAILPTERRIKRYFEDYFVLYRPKDIVSGDFYWVAREDAERKDEYTFVAVADCTGHGVSGAFMSMIGYSLLNEIVIQKKVFDPEKILTLLDERMREALRYDETTKQEGMDISLCRLEVGKNKTKVVFSGAKRPIYYTKSGILAEVKGDRKTIGGSEIEGRTFHNQEFSIEKGEMLYLFSDGYGDQKNVEDRKIGSNNLKKILALGAHLSTKEQHKNLEEYLNHCLQKHEQRDDITIVGVKI
jgi:ligand-binding sensor domain-containing protein/serine phosphatase RsbU (regulator of sigma subunit)